ncbi:MBL fold metallo-hydrolase [Ottowia sp.]|uniref:MBL fold metallo-hydrolase n=1 Tax=Ottowia sp. TaxID=1898956 RepID=UPI002BD42B70|nr:MBL fold metallo-hydrolase [Ottowia sp.]HOB65116.1 MBL fold metallo-hydrolase [Ottowia sp.]HPZ56249.1 MBL fold metallo-hydrolase [Ottowia sp.]HQD46585.1 MBL fold metallo-hydrolase [Ottowia sp.]
MSVAAELERALRYPLADQLPPRGGAITLAPGVKWLRMALPFALDHINLWLLRDHIDGREGWTVIDTCIDHPEARAAWEDVFATALEGLPILRVLVTHMHPDHVGLAHWLCERWSAPLWMSGTDYMAARYACQVVNSFGGDRLADYFFSHGMTDAGDLDQIRHRKSYYRNLVPAMPPSYARLRDGQTLTIGGQAWRCIAGHGHAPEHMALYCEAAGILISGDMVLPRISTNVSVYEMEPEADALTLFLDSIDRFLPLPADTLALPSHGKPFTGLHTRIQQLHDHHRDRLAEVMEAAQARPVSAYDVLPVLFKRPLDLHQTTFALGEAVAHLHRLWFAGRLRRARDAQGIWRFAVA